MSGFRLRCAEFDVSFVQSELLLSSGEPSAQFFDQTCRWIDHPAGTILFTPFGESVAAATIFPDAPIFWTNSSPAASRMEEERLSYVTAPSLSVPSRVPGSKGAAPGGRIPVVSIS